ncbi:NAD(P)-dependent alcohol dehydrogenase [Hymenobacter sp.]|uniref:zinc-dependent alcohol dehydrogenase family protein n=1 Tax=Hymenobacter sp. TaxID=1898978 RepID=UPI00286C57DD|nr:NAD(P)-dependent alcohol dehydrogenase [Hymenobacter sp.]
MKQYQIAKFGDISGLVLGEREVPVPQPHEVLVRVRATSLNRRDLYILHQTYPLPPRQDVVPLSDGAGEVTAVGAQVTRFKAGDRVAGSYFARWRDGRVGWDIADQLGCTLDGMLAEYVTLAEDALVQIPEHLSWAEAATLPCAALTAWSALAGPQPVAAGDTVLTIGSGGVPLFAIQFAKLVGAQVIALTSRDAKFDQLQALGADHVLNYRTDPAWARQVLALTGGRGVTRVVETGGTDTFGQSVLATAFGGEIALVSSVGSINTPATASLSDLLNPLFVGLITVRPIFVGSRLGFEAMNRAITAGRLRPVLDRTFAFDQVHEAYRYFAAGQHLGKVVITGSES